MNIVVEIYLNFINTKNLGTNNMKIIFDVEIIGDLKIIYDA